MNTSTPPIIGLTISRNYSDEGYPSLAVSEAYTQSVAQAGGAPFLIPLGLPAETLALLVSRLDGLLFTGGGDVHSSYYNSQPHPLVNSVDTDRDRAEIELFNLARQANLPIFGICRGIQLINIALGGTIYEDIQDQYPGGMNHATTDGLPRDYLAHSVQVEEDSLLRRILGASHIQVNSFHHQAIRLLAPGTRHVACAPDGIIEAVELLDYPFGLAVQWHPECLQEHAPMRNLFRTFVQAAGK